MQQQNALSDVEECVKINARLYHPQRWQALDPVLKTRFLTVERLLHGALQGNQPTYAQLDNFVFEKTKHTTIRPEIREVVAQRARHSYSMTQEGTCLSRALDERLYVTEHTIHESATQLRFLMFNQTDPPRTFDMTIVNHPWMLIKPPRKSDPVFSLLSEHSAGPALFGALNIYLILLSAHPYADGNGRTSRVMFNLHLAHAYHIRPRYIPIAELTRATRGVYEEHIARASKSGNYRKLILHLLELLESYAHFLRGCRVPQAQSELTEVMRLAGDFKVRGARTERINDCPPYLVSLKNVVADESALINRDFVSTIVEIGRILTAYGKIEFALTGLAELIGSSAPKAGAVAFFLSVDRKEDLVLHFRELRAKYRKLIRTQIAISTGDAVIDAKLLVHLVANYSNNNPASDNCAVLLHDFECVNGDPATI